MTKLQNFVVKRTVVINYLAFRMTTMSMTMMMTIMAKYQREQLWKPCL